MGGVDREAEWGFWEWMMAPSGLLHYSVYSFQVPFYYLERRRKISFTNAGILFTSFCTISPCPCWEGFKKHLLNEGQNIVICSSSPRTVGPSGAPHKSTYNSSLASWRTRCTYCCCQHQLCIFSLSVSTVLPPGGFFYSTGSLVHISIFKAMQWKWEKLHPMQQLFWVFVCLFYFIYSEYLLSWNCARMPASTGCVTQLAFSVTDTWLAAPS